MKALSKITDQLYSWITLIAIGIGLLVALLFLVSVLIGGSTGESLAVASGNLMTWAIRLATLAVLAGIINIYASKRHTLTMEKESVEEELNEEEVEKFKKNVVS